MRKEKFLIKKEKFFWDEFVMRLLINHEEFSFPYHDKMIHISYVSDNSTAIAYGDETIGFTTKDYGSPLEFLDDPIFEGKKISEIWEEIWG